MATGALQYVEAPVAPARRTGLLRVATVSEGTAERWHGGITWQSPRTGTAWYRTDQESTDPKTVGTVSPVEAESFYVGIAAEAGMLLDPALPEFLRARLDGAETVAVEAAVRDLVLVARGSALVSTATDLAHGLALLEQALAEQYGGLPVVHVDVYTAVLLAAADVVEHTGDGTLVTKVGTPVIPGAGYTAGEGVEVDSVTAGEGESWMFGTGWPVLRRSQMVTADAWDTTYNKRLALAERLYVAQVEAPVLAVLVSDSAEWS